MKVDPNRQPVRFLYEVVFGQGRGAVEPVTVVRGVGRTAVPVRPLPPFASTQFGAVAAARSVNRRTR